ncbi:hypothetical protein BOTBODRAFT_29264 [Botryobasidium botryosum FD-172 SS1]|uniref:Thioester reductase (TE) domain-containing protein n=1 Tax=Botryobasidium botryosum (strain FD-172 SS1) TaxID=930990 RepID=A0A067MQV2_BOTB1|nr:hypothetical protein BOTBODRAFT_29264 [Botryobasidium botryosum FD-172 SS1]
MGKIDELNALVARYTADFPAHCPRTPPVSPTSDVALLTGTTGGLGCVLLRDLVALPSVSRVYAFNRQDKGGRSLRERQAESLLERGLDPKILDSPKVILVEGNLAAPDLGVSKELYAELRELVTFIIHNAWRVNFTQALSTFEPLIRGVRNLVDFSLASPHPAPPRIIFPSSITAIMNWPLATPIPEVSLPEARVAIGLGYGESKWVSERILLTAAEKTAFRPVVVRVGQLTFGVNGSWNGTEWLPTILRSAFAMGVLPAVESPIPVLPLEAASKGLIEMVKSPYTVLHLVHPRPVPCSHIAQLIADELGLKIIPIADWLTRLEEAVDSAQDYEHEVERNPAVILLPLFHMFLPMLQKPGRDAMGLPNYDSTLAERVAPSLGGDQLPQTGLYDVRRVLKHWRENGLLQGIADDRERGTIARFAKL